MQEKNPPSYQQGPPSYRITSTPLIIKLDDEIQNNMQKVPS